MKSLLKTDTICSYNNNEPPCTHMLLKHADSKITTFLSSVLLCIYSFTVVNIPSIRFHMLHVYKQFYTCIFICLDKYTICFIVRPVCIIHLSLIMYLLCIHLYYVSLCTVYKMFVYYIFQYYGCVMSTYLSDSRTLINLFHLYIILYFIFHSALKNATQTLPKNAVAIMTPVSETVTTQIYLKSSVNTIYCSGTSPPKFSSCCFCGQIDSHIDISILVFCLYYLSSTILIIQEYPFSVKSILYYIYFMKTHHSILYIVLINSYDHRFIENITLSILNHRKNSRVGKSWNFDDIGKIITNSSYHQKCRYLHIFTKNHTCFF